MAEDVKPTRPAREKPKKAPQDAEAKAKKEETRKAAERKAEREEAKSEAEEEEEEEAREPQDEEEVEAPKPKAGRRGRKASKDGDDAAGEGKSTKHRARPKPKLSPDLKAALKLRDAKNKARPDFLREEWFRYQRLGEKWRYPQGIQSKMRRHWKTHADVVSIGHRGPKAARGLHPSGFREVMVYNADALGAIDPASEAVRISASVGRRKREEIQTASRKLGIRVLNWREY